MKRRNNNHIFKIVIIFTMFLTSSCLKTNDTFVDFSKVGTTIELPLAALNQETGVNVVTKEYKATDAVTDLPVVVNIASPKPLDYDLTVTLGVNSNDALGKLNAKLPSAGYVLIPSNVYTVSSLQVTIPAGQRTATVNFKINPANLTSDTNLILPVSIVDAGAEKISLYSTVYYNVLLKQ